MFDNTQAGTEQERFARNVMEFAHRDYPRLKAGDTIDEALRRLRGAAFQGQAVYFYVTDEDDRLVGVVSARSLLLSSPDRRLESLMQPRVVSLPHTATLEDACEMFILHRLLALPIVDEHGRMVGVLEAGVYTDEVVRWIENSEREHSADVFQLIGLHLEEIRGASTWYLVRHRLAWLGCNFAGGLLCAGMAWLFDDFLAEWIVFALFLPVVLALSESVSVQTLTTLLERHHRGTTSLKTLLRLFRREILIGTNLAVCLGTALGLIVWAWSGQLAVGLSMGTSLCLGVFAATMLGFTVPAVLLSMRRDPKVASGPIVLAATDLMALSAYLGLGCLMLG
ncbi:MAG: magnesium transporter [Planctomycetota bacterium]|nr:MAG: magnesium transporter [Planctomycetota bacterium]